MPYSPDEIFRLIQTSDHLNAETRLDIFEFLSASFSLIPLVGGFPAPGQSSREFKRPMEPNWQQWCERKRPFDRKDFAPERAGVACGPASGVLVLDIDDMGKFREWLAANVGEELPATLTVKTGGTGERYHFYFQYPDDGQRYPNRSVKGVFDIRGIGGQVLCPGSLHPETGKPYVIVESPEDLAPAPDWLRSYSLFKTTKPQVTVSTPDAHDHTQDQSMTPNTPATEPMPATTTPQITAMDPVLGDLIAGLQVPEHIKEKIVTPIPKGQRSEASMAVLVALLSAGVPEGTVRHIYAAYPIGEKARENDAAWLDRELTKAKEHIAANFDPTLVSSASQPPSKPSAPKRQYKTFNALDVVKSNANFEFLIDNFWPKGEPLLITGHGGAGKSILTLQIAMDLISPPPTGFLNVFRVNPGEHRVLFVQSENSLIGMKKRIDFVRNAYAFPDILLQDRMFFLGVNNDVRTSGDIKDPHFQDAIKDAVVLNKIDILVIDPLISFHSEDENSNDQMRRLLDKVSLLTEEIGVTPLLIHHHGKFATDSGAGGGRGASAIGDWSPNTWELGFNKTANQYTLQHNKARNFTIQDKLTLELVGLRFRATGSKALADEIQCVVTALQNLGGTANTMKALKDEVMRVYRLNNPGNSIVENTAKSYIKKSIKSGDIKESAVQNSNSKMYTF
ncbi:MAG: AAA family ATPase [Solidesulfovibrio sp. DCME]|uniref:AAA family ATPase n=1 Tax=Solidesulfovibrio sp. DCME TaxID=3447380 RepID=UPI003D115D4B